MRGAIRRILRLYVGMQEFAGWCGHDDLLGILISV
jgi:hypothetical protein